MSTEKQIAANRQNAKKSTGPLTPEAKARVSRNPSKHGLTGRDVVLPGENADAFDRFRADLLGDLNPQGELEALLAHKIVADAWRLRRVPILEAAFYRRGCKVLRVREAAQLVQYFESGERNRDFLAKAMLPVSDHKAYEDAVQKLSSAQTEPDGPFSEVTRVFETSPGPLLNLWRHEAALFRSLLRTMHELERLQARRAGQYVPVPEVADVAVTVFEPSRVDIEETGPNPETDGASAIAEKGPSA